MENINTIEIPELTLDKTPRKEQIESLDFIKKSLYENNKFTLLNLPTGTGKSFLTVMFMDWFKREYDVTASFDVLTNSKILQEQYTKDYEFMNSLWGKGSYWCEQYNTSCETGTELCRLNKAECDNCPYKTAKWKFDNGNIGLANYHLYLTYRLIVPEAWKRDSRVLIIDEADSFEDVFVDFLTTDINKYVFKANGFTDDETLEMIRLFDEGITMSEFVDLMENNLIPYSNNILSRLAKEYTETEDIKILEKSKTLSRTISKWELYIREYKIDENNWILDIQQKNTYTKDGKVKDSYLNFQSQPIWAYPYLDKHLWSKYDYVIMMSGTLLNKEITCKMNGLDINRTSYKSIESPFDVKNRPIYYFKNAGKQVYSTKEITWENQRKLLGKILKKHKNDKGIIHTANYELQRWLVNDFDDERLLTHTTEDRNIILESHYNSDNPTVLVSPSMNVGVDLPHDFSRFQVILKMPYPSLGSEKVKQRMKTMPEYYGLVTVRALIQAYGRSIRSKDDYADTYIIDSSFSNVLQRNQQYIPKWFMDAIKIVK